MSESTAECIRLYVERHYLSAAQLAERASCTVERLCALQLAQCIPVHSYELRSSHLFSSTFGDHAVAGQPQRYYHPSVLGWLRTALDRAAGSPLAAVARRYREDFERDFEIALAGREPPWPGGVDYAWAYLMDGTWGLCLKEISAQNMLLKEFARGLIRRANRRPPGAELSAAQRAELAQAVADYRRVVLPFAPHERERSSSVLELAPALTRLAANRPGG